MPAYSRIQATVSASPDTSSQNNSVVVGSTVLLLLLPVAVVLGIVSYRKYCAATLQRQIQLLERMWLLSSNGMRDQERG